MRATINISLPEHMRTWVDEQVARGDYGTVSEYFRQLIREEQKRQIRRRIDEKLLAALDSGEPVEITPELWEENCQIIERARARKAGREL